MDLPLYLRVLWRFRLLVAFGTVLAIALALLVTVRVSLSSPYLAYRQSQTWSSESRVFVTQQGFPWGYAAPPTVSTTPAADSCHIAAYQARTVHRSGATARLRIEQFLWMRTQRPSSMRDRTSSI